jgi:hypothetical protein
MDDEHGESHHGRTGKTVVTDGGCLGKAVPNVTVPAYAVAARPNIGRKLGRSAFFNRQFLLMAV